MLKNRNVFSLVFLIVLITDVIIKTTHNLSAIRFVSKISLSVLLILFYILNQKETNKIKIVFMISALLFFLIGDVFFILYEIEVYYILGILSFAIGKLFYVLRFSNQRDFKLYKTLPVVLFCFSLMLIMLYLINNNLNNYFLPTLVYLFTVTMFVVFAFLRKGSANNKSYYLVLLGVFLSLFSDCITALSSFYSSSIPYQAIAIMLFYGMSQFFIVSGVVKETNFMSH